MNYLLWFGGVSSLSVLWLGMNPVVVQAEPVALFKPILGDIQQQLPNGLQMRLPAYLPENAMTLHPFVKSDSKGLQVYLSREAICNQPKCSVGGIAVFTQEGFSQWSRQLKNSTPVSLPNGIQGYYLALGKEENADHYVLWQQDGFGFVLGTDRRSASQQELIQIAASAVVESPIRKLDKSSNVLIESDPNVTGEFPVSQPFTKCRN